MTDNLSSRLQSCFRLLVLLAAPLAATPVTAQDAPAPTLDWVLVNPFRFIHDREMVDELRSVFAEVEHNESTTPVDARTPVYDLERALQKLADGEVEGRRAEARASLNCNDRNATDDVKRRCFEPYAGWFARLAWDNYSKTCWDPVTQNFRTDVVACRDYIYPEYQWVRVWAENPRQTGAPLSQPTWLIDGQPLIGSKFKFNDCDAKYQKPLCVEIRLPYEANNPRKLMVSVVLSDGGTIALPQPLEVVDRLVVGLGDSYASGEGNPDRPARFTRGETDRDVLPKLLQGGIPRDIRGTRHPRKDGEGGQARWLDDRCHRSMYSYQFKTALQMALSNPQEAVTYVSYSCSGATTDEIIDKWAKAKEKGEAGEEKRRTVAPQLDSLRKVLSKDGKITREIDYLLLSTGGNDIEFSSFVTYAVLSGKALWAFEQLPFKGMDEQKIVRASKRETFKNELLGRDGNYAHLHKALLDAPSEVRGRLRRRAVPDEARRIRIKGCQPGGPCLRIVLTPYPNVLYDQDGHRCKADKKEFDNPFGADTSRENRIKTLDDYVFSQIRDVQADRSITDAAGLGWTVVSNNVGAYARHGFCAQSPLSRLSPLDVQENFELPRWTGTDWQPFDPTRYKAYASRLRWVRLPVDSKLMTDQMHVILGKLRLDIFLEDDIANIMHPTAEGLSATADANFKVIQTLAASPQKNPPPVQE